MNTTTTTTNNNNIATANEALVRAANDKLVKSLGKDSLDDLVRARTRRSLLLVDCSASMGQLTRKGERRIDALRKVVENLRTTQPVPVAAFYSNSVRLVDEMIPEPCGGTPMAEAINYGKSQGANHLCLVTDGEAGFVEGVYESARNFGGPIDTFYIGSGRDHGARVCQAIADMTGGTAHLTDLGEVKQLASTLRGLLGDGSI